MPSSKQFVLITLFFLGFIFLVIIMFRQTYLDDFTFFAVLLLVIEWWRACCYFKTIKGELALFHNINELYWHRQRWFIMGKPILLRYIVILHLRSKRNNQIRILFLMDDSFISQDWRSWHYHLRQIEI